jgi:F-type H+-transporting ATPase subunit delta
VDSLTRLYGRPISLQVELDPSLLGGLVVRVGGELIDGSVAGRLAAARRNMPS